MQDTFRLKEYMVTLYRLSLAFLFYFIARVLFFIYNIDLFEIDNLFGFLKICFLGT